MYSDGSSSKKPYSELLNNYMRKEELEISPERVAKSQLKKPESFVIDIPNQSDQSKKGSRGNQKYNRPS
jgi:hypothetical protein